MGVFDGQPVNAAVTNPAFIDANADDTGYGKYTLANTDPQSGPVISNIQALMNQTASGVGSSITQNGTTYGSTQRIFMGENHQDAISALDSAFHGVTGHMHSGAPGDGPPIMNTAVTGNNFRQYFILAPTIGVTGSFVDVSSTLGGEGLSTGSNVTGLVVDPPYNKVLVRGANPTGSHYQESFTDSFGNPVFGRLTATGATRELHFFSNQLGVEIPYSFTASGESVVEYAYPEIFNPIQNLAPVYDPIAQLFDVKVRPITYNQVSGNPLQNYYHQSSFDFIASGFGQNITSIVSGFANSTGPTVEGLVVLPPYNKAFLRAASGNSAGQFFTDTGSNIIYGRITATGANRSLSYYSLVAGAETPYNFTTTGWMRFYYPTLLNPLNPTTPAYDNLNQIFDVGGLGGGGGGNSGFAQDVVTITMDYSPNTTVDTIMASGVLTVSLPSIDSNYDKKLYTIKKIDSASGGVIVEAAPGNFIDGATGYTITNQYDSVHLVGDIDNSSWWIL